MGGATDAAPGPEPSAAGIQEQGFGWTIKPEGGNTGVGKDAVTSGLEGAWTAKPVEWDGGYFHNLFKYEWEMMKSPAGAIQWKPKNNEASDAVPLAHGTGKTHPIMLTTDLSLRYDPAYAVISKKFAENFNAFEQAYRDAWYKLTHRDLGPRRRYLGGSVGPERIWQDPITPLAGVPVSAGSVNLLKKKIMAKFGEKRAALLVEAAWSGAGTFRHTDMRGGTNGGRLFLEPQRSWECNKKVVGVLEDLDELANTFNEEMLKKLSSQRISRADMLVLAGCAGVEALSVDAKVGFTPGRGDATQCKTDVASFKVLEPRNDAFRNYNGAEPYDLVDRAHLLGLTASEMAVLVAGFRSVGISNAEKMGCFDPESGLDNSFFVNLLEVDSRKWVPCCSKGKGTVFEAVSRANEGEKKGLKATSVDLAFVSDPELRAIAELYACGDSKERFVKDFCAAFQKVMEADMYDGSWTQDMTG